MFSTVREKDRDYFPKEPKLTVYFKPRRSVYRGVGTELLNIKQVTSRFTAEVPILSQPSQCEICGGSNGTGTGFSPSASLFLSVYHSTSILHLTLSVCCSY